jgi:membrane-bound ClpP family serine protease
VCTALVIWFVRTKYWKKITLDDKLESKVNVIDEQKIKVGDEGNTVSRLAPTGHASFAGETFEVQSIDGFIDPKTPIKVVRIEASKILVAIL